MRHKPAIGDEDLKKLKTSQAIPLTSALTLLQSVWFHVVLFFCRRGREGQKELKRSSFKFKVDASGRKFFQWRTMKQPKIILVDLLTSRAMKRSQGCTKPLKKNDGYKPMEIYLAKVTSE